MKDKKDGIVRSIKGRSQTETKRIMAEAKNN